MKRPNRNHVELTGHLWITPDLQRTVAGKPYLQFRLATKRGYGKYSKTDMLTVVLWEQQALEAAKVLRPGLDVSVKGMLITRGYKGAEDGRVIQECMVSCNWWKIGEMEAGDDPVTM